MTATGGRAGNHGRPREATGGHGRPREAAGGYGRPLVATGAHERPREATGGRREATGGCGRPGGAPWRARERPLEGANANSRAQNLAVSPLKLFEDQLLRHPFRPFKIRRNVDKYRTVGLKS